MKTKCLVTALAVLTLGALATLYADCSTPPSEWTRFGSSSSTINGTAMPVGVIIEAYDNTAVLSGEAIVTAVGQYAMDVYGDDPYSTDCDEGCDLNEPIIFKINGIVAQELGPATDLWLGKGPIQIMNLASIQDFSVSITGPGGGTAKPGTSISYFINVVNNGDGIDKITLTGSSTSGWTIIGLNPGGDYIKPGQSKTYEVIINVPGGYDDGYEDTLSLMATSLFDPAASFDKKIITTVSSITSVDEAEFTLPGTFTLHQNFPNPFNPETVISFRLEKAGEVALEVFNLLGAKVATLHRGYLGSGNYEFRWTGADDHGSAVSSGIYFYRLVSGGGTLTRKMTLLK